MVPRMVRFRAPGFRAERYYHPARCDLAIVDNGEDLGEHPPRLLVPWVDPASHIQVGLPGRLQSLQHLPAVFELGRRSPLLKKLYIGNIPYTCTDQDLAEWFTQGGYNTQSVTILRDRATGQSRGFGFVEIQNDEEADRAIASLNGKAFMGRALVVNEARPPAPRGPGGRGEGGGRERRGGGGGRYRE